MIEFSHVGIGTVFVDLDFVVAKGETLVLLGASGVGKSTALDLVNALRLPDRGVVRVEGRATTDWDPLELRRKVGYVQQEGALFPHLTVGENVGLVPRLAGRPKAEVAQIVAKTLTMVDLDGFAGRMPLTLSGGQKQRAAVARALSGEAPMMVLDEPFSALDPLTRTALQRAFVQLTRATHKTVIFVTHDLHEATVVGDHVALLAEGRVVAHSPANEFLHLDHPLVRAYVDTFS